MVKTYDICFNYDWQNTGETNIDGGPNHITLAEAQKQYKETGKIIRPEPKSVKVIGYGEFGIPITEIEY
ncbi:CPCC family cysteine-rich protein [Lactobacillus pasteurii]|uniref:Cysteine-rich CPCC domain-containing protein n=1 Tax=Lactobacillus pasteurii DSM 23907 = CRBIP 24.76 TaxID=1423790 RepID=I7LDZ6_9LACO|nr:Putative uncharacterized protein [Lactobacillus pasteurii DSM 23907 = CRBIP 24.76]